MTGSSGFLDQLIGELERRERLSNGGTAQHPIENMDSSAQLPLPISRSIFSTPLEAIVQPVKELTGGMNELSGQVRSLRETTQASVENFASNTKALELSMQAIRSIGSSAGPQAGLGLGSSLSLLPLFTGIKSLFGGNDENRTVTALTAPSEAQSREFSLSGSTPMSYGERGAARMPAPREIHVHVRTMDSQSFADNSEKIAEAVRTAMLQSGALTDVWGEY